MFDVVDLDEFQSVSGLWDRRNLVSAAWLGLYIVFQSVSGLWDRRNSARRVFCSSVSLVSIRLRSVGPEKFEEEERIAAEQKFQSVSGLWDRRNAGPSRSARSRPVSIRLRSVGPEKWRSATTPPRAARFNPSPVCGTGEIPCPGPCAPARRCFNPSPVCGTGEISGPPRGHGGGQVSIRLRSVGPEKLDRE